MLDCGRKITFSAGKKKVIAVMRGHPKAGNSCNHLHPKFCVNAIACICWLLMPYLESQ
jgi:hypothetical protein